MTFIQGIVKPNHIWICTDNRVSVNGKFRDDNNIKHVGIKCPDGTILLSYTGLAELPDKTKISDWIRTILRGETLSIEQTVQKIIECANLEIADLYTLVFVLVAFTNKKAFIYEIKNIKDNQSFSSPIKKFWAIKQEVKNSMYFITGSGAGYMAKKERDAIAKIVAKNPKTPKDFLNLLIKYNKSISNRDTERVSESCIAAEMPSTGEPVSTIHHKSKEGVAVPFVMMGIDTTEMMKALINKEKYTKAMGETSITPRIIKSKR